MALTQEQMVQLLSQKVARPNAIQAAGAALSGGAAPFLGQQWTNPYAKATTGGGGIDIKDLMLMQMMGGGETPTATPDINKAIATPDQGTLRDFFDAKRPDAGNEGLIEKEFGIKGDKLAAQELHDKTQEEKMKKGLAFDFKQKEAIRDARKTNTSVQLATNMFADGMVDVYRASDTALQEEFGVKLDPTRGLEGKAFAFLQKAMGKLGYNSYFDSVAKGMTNELAAEFAKAGGASRLGFFILNAFRDTIPKLGEETLESGGFQLIKSATNGYRKYLKEAFPDEDFTVLQTKLRDFEAKTTQQIMQGFTDAGIYTPKVYEFKPEGSEKTYRMPDYMIPFWAEDNDIKLKDIDRVKKQYKAVD